MENLKPGLDFISEYISYFLPAYFLAGRREMGMLGDDLDHIQKSIIEHFAEIYAQAKETGFFDLHSDEENGRVLPSTPTPKYVRLALMLLIPWYGTRKEGNEAWIEKNKELEKQALDGDDEAFFELIKRDFRYLYWGYTVYKILKWRWTIEMDENKKEVEKAEECLKRISLVPVKKGPPSKIDRERILPSNSNFGI